MWLEVLVPDFGAGARVRIARYHAGIGDRIGPGSPIVDLDVDLSGGVVRDCPPVSTCRIFAREGGFVRRLRVADAADPVAGDVVAMLSQEADALEDGPARPARVTSAAVVHHVDWWDDEA